MVVTSPSSPIIAKQWASSMEISNVAVLSSVRVAPGLVAINATPKLCEPIPQLVLHLEPNGGALLCS